MEWAPAQKQMIVWDIGIGKAVSPNEAEWAVREGYAEWINGELKVTDKGWAFYGRS